MKTELFIGQNVASTKDTKLIGRISDVVQPERGTDFVA
jgi:hypothetical protein